MRFYCIHFLNASQPQKKKTQRTNPAWTTKSAKWWERQPQTRQWWDAYCPWYPPSPRVIILGLQWEWCGRVLNSIHLLPVPMVQNWWVYQTYRSIIEHPETHTLNKLSSPKSHHFYTWKMAFLLLFLCCTMTRMLLKHVLLAATLTSHHRYNVTKWSPLQCYSHPHQKSVWSWMKHTYTSARSCP